jgi:membrane protease YdiL (CAAX protease family)
LHEHARATSLRSPAAWGIWAAALGATALGLRQVSALAPLIAVLVGTAGLLAPLPKAREQHRSMANALVGLAAGVAAFALATALVQAAGGSTEAARWTPPTTAAVAASLVAAVAEEALFRRLAYGLLLPAGVGIAVTGSALLFAMVHVPLYSWAILPIDLAAGVVLGWQRWASGGWAVPAITHAAANLTAFL